MAINYKNGKIYKIEPRGDHSEGDVYIGSTTKEYLSQRMTAHRGAFKSFKSGSRKHKLTSFNLFDKYGVENCDIILLESVEANSKDELVSREAHYIRTIKCVNRFVPLRTTREYKQEHKEVISQKNKIKFTCECGSTLRKCDKAAHFKTWKHQFYLATSEGETQCT
jgi:hypothetical protein